jgi:uncharacterized SAM-binding protein YcdF (DUF218 family)
MAPLVVASGGRRWHGHSEAEVMRRALRDAAVPEDQILLELRSLSTLENALFSAALLRERGASRVVLATCHWHVPRAAAAFEHYGLEAVAPPTQWYERTDVPLRARVRERLCRWADSAMMARGGR